MRNVSFSPDKESLTIQNMNISYFRFLEKYIMPNLIREVPELTHLVKLRTASDIQKYLNKLLKLDGSDSLSENVPVKSTTGLSRVSEKDISKQTMPFNRVHSNYSKSSGPAEYQLHTRKDENKNQSMTDNSLIREKHNLEESMSFKGKPALRRLHTISNEAEVKKELGVTFAHNMGNFNTAHNTGLNNTVNNTLNHISAWSPNTENSRHASVISNASTVPVQTTSIHQPQPQTINMLKETNKTEYTFPLKRKQTSNEQQPTTQQTYAPSISEDNTLKKEHIRAVIKKLGKVFKDNRMKIDRYTSPSSKMLSINSSKTITKSHQIKPYSTCQEIISKN